MKFILASGSPRRYEILKNLGLDFTVILPSADESSGLADAGKLTEELARRKGRDVALKVLDDSIVISCDTVVSVDGRILGKPRDEAEAAEMLRLLSGRVHEVYSGICIISGSRAVTAHEVTRVKFASMTEQDIERCVRLGSPCDKAGGYAVQGIASLYIAGIEGDYFNVVGLPVHLLAETLRVGFGIELADFLKGGD